MLPVTLAKWGPKLDKRRLRDDDKASRSWTRWAQFVVRRRWLAAGTARGTVLVFDAEDKPRGAA